MKVYFLDKIIVVFGHSVTYTAIEYEKVAMEYCFVSLEDIFNSRQFSCPNIWELFRIVGGALNKLYITN